jgi:hypothetical protein
LSLFPITDKHLSITLTDSDIEQARRLRFVYTELRATCQLWANYLAPMLVSTQEASTNTRHRECWLMDGPTCVDCRDGIAFGKQLSVAMNYFGRVDKRYIELGILPPLEPLNINRPNNL